MKNIIAQAIVIVSAATPWPSFANNSNITHAAVYPDATIVLAVRTGDDDDIDDLIVERARKKAERKRTGNSGSGATETEDDLDAGNKPTADSAPANSTTSTLPSPSPALPSRSSPAARTGVLENIPAGTPRLATRASGTLSPASGKTNTFVTINGPNFAKTERVMVAWYPDDDDSQPQAGMITATLRKRTGSDEIEIEMPTNAGGASGGVVRVYLIMPGQLQPVLAGRFTVSLAAPAETVPTAPIFITTPALVMKGKRPQPEEIPTTPIFITTAPLIMQGKRPPAEIIPVTPIVIITPALKMTGKRASLQGVPMPPGLDRIIERTTRPMQ